MNDQNDSGKAPDENVGKKKKRSKKNALIFFGVLIVLMVVLVLLNNMDIDPFADRSTRSGKKTTQNAYSDKAAVTIDPFFLAQPDYDEDITLDKEYMKESRFLHYSNANETFEIIDRSDSVDNICRMFYDYFEAAKAGDNDAYYALFTDYYIKSAGKKVFAPQKLYNIKVNCFKSEHLTNGDANGRYKGYIVYYCDVSYNIKDNNGTLRNDFYGDDSTLPLIFEVIEKDDDAKINNIRRYVYQKDKDEKDGSLFSPMFFVWLGIFAVSAILAVALRKQYLASIAAASFALILLSIFIKSVLLQILIFALVTGVLLAAAAVIKAVKERRNAIK